MTAPATLPLTGVTNGSIGVVETPIEGSDAPSRTAYVWNTANETEDKWEALDGNYTADKVYFKDDITLAGTYTEVGNIKRMNGTLPAAGKSVKTLFDNIFTKELSGSKSSDPTVTGTALSGKVNGVTLAKAGQSYEYGTYLTDL